MAVIDPSQTWAPLEQRFMATRTNVLEFAIDRLVVDDPDADDLVVYRQVLLWPLDGGGKIIGEDSYFAGVRSVTAVAREDLPQQYLDLVHTPAANA